MLLEDNTIHRVDEVRRFSVKQISKTKMPIDMLASYFICFCHWNWWEEDHGIVGVGALLSTGAEMDHLAGAISGNKTSTTRPRIPLTAGPAPTLFIFHVMETLAAAVMTKPLSIKHT